MEFVLNWGQMRPTEYSPRSNNPAPSQKSHTFHQRYRLWVDIVASEALKGVFGFENNMEWGRNSASRGSAQLGQYGGGASGSRGVSLEVLHAYVDWLVPSTDLRVRVGMQPVANPTYVENSQQVVSEHLAGIVLSYTPASAPVGVVAWWVRPYADNGSPYKTAPDNKANITASHRWNDIDAFGIALPMSFDGVKVAPWGMYAAIGRDAFTDYRTTSGFTTNAVDKNRDPASISGGTGGRTNFALGYLAGPWYPVLVGDKATSAAKKGQGQAFWFGLTGELTMFNPFRLAWDFNYGSVDLGKVKDIDSKDLPVVGKDRSGTDIKFDPSGWKILREGYILNLLAEYKLDFATPGIAYWYASGDKSKWEKGSGMMPALRPSSKMTSFGQETQSSWTYSNGAFSYSLAGTQGLMLQMKDMTFAKDLKHNIRLAYYQGTNSASGVKKGWTGTSKPDETTNYDFPYVFPNNGGGNPNVMYLTTKDTAYEVNVDTYYDIYKNLQLAIELGYIKLNLSDSVWGKKAYKKSSQAKAGDLNGWGAGGKKFLNDTTQAMTKATIGLRYTF